jgi:hypothetical protein
MHAKERLTATAAAPPPVLLLLLLLLLLPDCARSLALTRCSSLSCDSAAPCASPPGVGAVSLVYSCIRSGSAAPPPPPPIDAPCTQCIRHGDPMHAQERLTAAAAAAPAGRSELRHKLLRLGGGERGHLFNQHRDKNRTTHQCKGRVISVTHAHKLIHISPPSASPVAARRRSRGRRRCCRSGA